MADMTLREWINNGGSIRQIQQAAGVHYVTAWKWASSRKIPSWKHIPAIERATNGAVTAADFVPQQGDAA
jgi:DNA-binding transcriptional regulator YdaS (Cro superfamily)